VTDDDRTKPGDETTADETATTEDDARRKFREALDRKRHRESHGAAPADSGRSLLAHESTKRQRQFRRKSG
jgi:hypothetical protein